ncbi:MAG: DUF6112 family protein [bacterium]|nr:DUF6112 family protein [bacterium]
MNHLWKKRLAAAVPFAILLVGFLAFAVDCNPAESKIYCNPLGEVREIEDLVRTILKTLLQVTIPLAGLGIIIAGLNYALAAASGNTSRTTTAKNILKYVLIGCFVVVGALALANAAINFIKALK